MSQPPTDLARFVELLTSWEVEHEISTDERAQQRTETPRPVVVVTLRSGAERVEGYFMYYAEFIFGTEGEFGWAGVWE